MNDQNAFPTADDDFLSTDFTQPAHQQFARKRGHPILAWMLIVIAVTAVVIYQNSQPGEEKRSGTAGSSKDIVLLLSGRYLTGAADLFPQEAERLYQEAILLNQGSIEQRFGFVALASELAGPEEALRLLDQLDLELHKSGIELTDKQAKLRAVLRRLQTDYADRQFNAPSVGDEERKWLQSELGWLGRLILAPKGGKDQVARAEVIGAARRTVFMVGGAAGLACLFGLAGFLGLFVFLAVLVAGGLRGGLKCGVPHAGIYAETFAVWIVLYICLSAAASFLPVKGSELLIAACSMLLSLVALAWPVLRGVPWRQVKRDTGLETGRWSFFEPVVGLGCYALTIPFLTVGMLLTLILFVAVGMLGQPANAADPFAPSGVPHHPLIDMVTNVGWWSGAQLFLAVSLAAPIVEETMFRGVLYRHLREISARWGFLLSFLISAFVNSLVFAIIHPQGLIAVPALMSIAFGLTLAREWRVSLVPAMVAHGLHNGLLMAVLLLALSG